MAMIKCKMCGGDLEIIAENSVATCEYCGTQQTVPNADNEKKMTLFGRANRLRMACEFDKAAGVYESIVAEFPEEAEAYWGLVLCKYGIEYVDDPATGKKIPTCHRSSFECVMDDSNLEQALENTDSMARRVYREEAKVIEELRKGIIEISGKEEPYDIFICYKETAENGERTIDSVIAQDVYDALMEKGYRVFFSRITLEDKLGQEYEPYIFAALHSAKIMLAFGTDYEHYNAVWVKNEWSRFLQLIAAGEKKTLIPCYKGIDAYDMPKEFARLQAQDMGKVGAIQDLLRGIEKILPHKKKTVQETVVVQQREHGDASPLLRRAMMFLEDGDWKNADVYSEKVLDLEPECAEAYIVKVCVKTKRRNIDEVISELSSDVEKNLSFQKALRFATPKLAEELRGKIAETVRKKETAAAELQRREEELRQRMEALRRRNTAAQGLVCVSLCHMVGLKLDGTVVATGENDKGQCNVSDWTDIVMVCAMENSTIGLKLDGTVVTVGEEEVDLREVSKWTDIATISTGEMHVVGLKLDGTVVAAGNNEYGQCNVSDWEDIVAIAIGEEHTIGLRSDGTVVAVGQNVYDQCDVSGWCDIVAISAGGNHTVGLRADGTVVAVGMDIDNRCNVSGWTDIVAVSAGTFHTVGLRIDGTVVAVGDNEYGQCDVGDWSDIVSVSVGSDQTLGLRSNGTVIAVGDNEYGQCNVSDWTDIVAIGDTDTIGLRLDGTVVTCFDEDEFDVSDWKLFDNIYELAEERSRQKVELEEKRRIALERRKEFRKIERGEKQAALQAEQAKLQNEQDELQTELSTLKGLFSGNRRREIESRLAEIAKQLAKIDSELQKIEKELAELKELIVETK